MMSEKLASIGTIHAFHKAPYRLDVQFFSETAMREIVGNVEKKRKLMERVFSISLHQSGDLIFALGEQKPLEVWKKAIIQLLSLIEKGHLLRFPDFSHYCRLIAREPTVDLSALQKECIFSGKRNLLKIFVFVILTKFPGILKTFF